MIGLIARRFAAVPAALRLPAPQRAFSASPKAFVVDISARKPARLRRINPLAILGTNAPPEPEEAVDNILYNAPKASKGPTNRHVLTLLVANETGVLSRISGVIAARGFNIESIVVCKTEVPALSRMTVVLKGQAAEVEQARRQLDDLVPVWAVLDYTGTPIVERELALVKVSAIPPEAEAAHDELALTPDAAARAGGAMSPIMAAGFHRQNVIALAQNMGAVVEDISHDAIVLQLTAKPEKVDAFVSLMKPYGLVEVVRSGCMAVPRSPIETYDETNGEEPVSAAMAVDASQLPPG
ncbi:small subunit of acetolactate synthase-domain-containing protein [Obelidium mucronatum]|nr:small subunit of acetolactate synthase-domain-containing protein [Obelidium mucronatum]